MPKVKRGQRKRAYRPKTRTGCFTCKYPSPYIYQYHCSLCHVNLVRRIKCDEAKPSCVKCTSTGRKCDGYALDNQADYASSSSPSTSASAVSRVLTPLSVQISGTSKERRAFYFFCERTAPQLSGFYGCEFWDRLVLQTAHFEPAIRHGIFALGALHESFENGANKGTTNDVIGFPLQQYQIAINKLLCPIFGNQKQAMDIALASCVIFVCFESIRGHFSSALAHINSGLKIFCELQTNHGNQQLEHPVLTSSRTPYIPLEIFQTLYTRLDTQVIQLTGDRASDIAKRSRMMKSNTLIPESFSSVSEARQVLEYHGHEFFYFLAHKPKETLEHVTIQETKDRNQIFFKLLRQWTRALDNFVQNRGQDLTIKERIGVLVLEIHRRNAEVSLDLTRTIIDDQTLMDQYRSIHEEIINLAESAIELLPLVESPSSTRGPTFSPDIGLVSPLFTVIGCCRDPILRRRGISILRRMNRQEGMWDSQMVARISEKIVEIEEEGLGVVLCAGDVPDWARISGIDPEFDVAGRRAVITYGRFESPSGIVRQRVQEVFEW